MEMIVFVISTLNEDRAGNLEIKFDEMPVVVAERLFTCRTPDLQSLSSRFLVILP
jgi:hypothetical protein